MQTRMMLTIITQPAALGKSFTRSMATEAAVGDITRSATNSHTIIQSWNPGMSSGSDILSNLVPPSRARRRRRCALVNSIKKHSKKLTPPSPHSLDRPRYHPQLPLARAHLPRAMVRPAPLPAPAPRHPPPGRRLRGRRHPPGHRLLQDALRSPRLASQDPPAKGFRPRAPGQQAEPHPARRWKDVWPSSARLLHPPQQEGLRQGLAHRPELPLPQGRAHHLRGRHGPAAADRL